MEAFLYHQDKYFTLDPVYDYISKSPIELSNAFSRFNSFESIHVEKSTSSTPQVSLEKKRKQSDDSCLSTGQSKGRKESTKSRRKESKAKDLNSTRNGEPPSGFIHVRARRGQATDSHSLAERVRRERISDRMKKLQELVPGCENVIGKALVLEEIINYVQSLQNQVEFLSMRLASVNPVVYDFGGAYEDYMGQREEMGSTSQSMPCVTQNSHIPPTAFEGATNRPQQVMDTAAVFTLYHEQGPPAFSQDGGSNIMQVGDQRRSIINQVELLKQHVLFPIEEKQMGASQNIWSCDQ